MKWLIAITLSIISSLIISAQGIPLGSVSNGSGGGGSGITIAQTQFCSNSSLGSATFTCQFTIQNTTAGDAIDIHVYAQASFSTFNTVGDGGDTCAFIGSTQTSSTGIHGQQAYCKNITGGSRLTVSVTFASSAFQKVAIYLAELKGVNTSTPIDNYTAGTPTDGWNNSESAFTGAGTTITTGNIIGVTASDLYSGSVWDINGNGGTMTAGSGYTGTGCTGCSGSGVDQTFSESFTPISKVIVSAGTSAITWTDSTTSVPLALGAAYRQ